MGNNDFVRYKLVFEDVFQNDLAYSRKFAKSANAVVMRSLAEIYDHEKRLTNEDCLKDAQGADRTIKIQPFTCGVRVRRPSYVHFGDFTMDTKEYAKPEQPHYYISGYGRKDESSFAFYMLWDQKQFIKLAKENKIKHTLERNKKHSRVWFLAFKFKDVFDQCDILETGGDLDIIRQVLGDRKVVNTYKLGEFV